MTFRYSNFSRLTLVSIHTPTKGVTLLGTYASTLYISFNPHTHEGCDLNCHNLKATHEVFQSTHPRRVWPISSVITYPRMKFQSTHPRRVWQFATWYGTINNMFQSTHPRRVWRGFEGCKGAKMEFQSTHPRRVWLLPIFAMNLSSWFQSTHPRRVWLHIQQIAEYHDAKIIILRKMAK